jgi:hypothetical protein
MLTWVRTNDTFFLQKSLEGEKQLKKQAFIFGVTGIFLLCQLLTAQTWEKTKRLTYTVGDSSNTAIATDTDNNIHVVWDDITSGNNEIFYRKGIQ